MIRMYSLNLPRLDFKNHYLCTFTITLARLQLKNTFRFLWHVMNKLAAREVRKNFLNDI